MQLEGTDLPVWGMEIDPDKAKQQFRSYSATEKGNKVGANLCTVLLAICNAAQHCPAQSCCITYAIWAHPLSNLSFKTLYPVSTLVLIVPAWLVYHCIHSCLAACRQEMTFKGLCVAASFCMLQYMTQAHAR